MKEVDVVIDSIQMVPAENRIEVGYVAKLTRFLVNERKRTLFLKV